MSKSSPSGPSHRSRKLVAAVLGHFLATLVFFALFVGMFMTEKTLALVEIGVRDAQMQSDVLVPLAIIFGLSACAWAFTFIVIGLVRVNLRTAPKVALQKSRGTVITETLIVFPVFLLLTFGMAQLAVNSIGGLLATLASYEVARSLSVWAPEEGNRASRPQIEAKARLVAAGVLAPVVPELQSGLCANPGNSLEAMRRGLTGVGMNAAVGGDVSKSSFAESLGTGAFADRGPTKLTLAYCNIEVSWTGPTSTNTDSVSTSAVNARVRYHHPAVFPLVGVIFTNNFGGGLWSTNYVSTFDKQYMLFSQLTPNIHLPYTDPNMFWSNIP